MSNRKTCKCGEEYTYECYHCETDDCCQCNKPKPKYWAEDCYDCGKNLCSDCCTINNKKYKIDDFMGDFQGIIDSTFCLPCFYKRFCSSKDGNIIATYISNNRKQFICKGNSLEDLISIIN
jgi:hypothetical protein